MKLLTNKKFQKLIEKAKKDGEYELLMELNDIFIDCESEAEFANKFYQFKNRFFEEIYR